MMQILTLQFPFVLHPGNIPALRAEIAQIVGLEHELFHQHNNNSETNDPYLRNYPKIQYAVRRGRACVIGINEGAMAIKTQLLPKLPATMELNHQTYRTGDFRMLQREVECGIGEMNNFQGIVGWLALNQENYQVWKLDEDEEARQQLLSRALTGHLRAFGEAMGLADFKSLHGNVINVDHKKRISWHGTQLVSFDVLVQTNLKIPAGIGIGRAASFGFGEVKSFVAYAKHRMERNKSDEMLVLE